MRVATVDDESLQDVVLSDYFNLVATDLKFLRLGVLDKDNWLGDEVNAAVNYSNTLLEDLGETSERNGLHTGR